MRPAARRSPAPLVARASLVAVAVVAVVVAGLSGCPKKDEDAAPAVVDDAAIVQDALAGQNTRLSAVRDYALEGEVTDVDSKQTLRFRYAMQQPRYSVGELLDASGNRSRAFVFDGRLLAIVDDATKTVSRQDLSSDEQQMLFALHEIFSQFVCEGWRPPLVKPQGTTGTRAGNTIVLAVPIVDEQLALQRLTLRDDGAFVKKELIDKHGQVVTSTTVLEDVVDDGTKLAFPKRWRHTENGSTQEVTLTKVAINAGVDPTRFSTATPAGFTDRTAQ